MKTIRWSPLLPLLLLLGLLAPVQATALDVPRLSGRVQDMASILSADTERRLDAFLKDFEAGDSTQIVVLTLPTLEGEPLEDYAIRVAQTWSLGQKGKDNGALLLVAVAERRVRIEVGYGLEGRLTDLLAGRIVDQEITPRFKQKDFDGGVLAGVTAMAQAVRGEYQGSGQVAGKKKGRSPIGLLALLFFLGPGLMLLGGPRSVHRHRRSGIWMGGPFGGGGFGGGGGFSGGGGGFGGGGASGGW